MARKRVGSEDRRNGSPSSLRRRSACQSIVEGFLSFSRGPGRSEARSDPAVRGRARACRAARKPAPQEGRGHHRGRGRRGPRTRRRRPQAAPGAAKPRAERHPGIAPRAPVSRSVSRARVAEGGRASRCATTAPGCLPRCSSGIRKPYFTTKEGGTGPGASPWARGVSFEQHGGRLEFKSSAGNGTTVTIVPPVEGEAVHEAAKTRRARFGPDGDVDVTEPAIGRCTPETMSRVLVIDDDASAGGSHSRPCSATAGLIVEGVRESGASGPLRRSIRAAADVVLTEPRHARHGWHAGARGGCARERPRTCRCSC